MACLILAIKLVPSFLLAYSLGPTWYCLRGAFYRLALILKEVASSLKTLLAMGITPELTSSEPWGFKNSDNKIITGTNVAQLSPVVSKHACAIQRGFVQGRQFVLNIADLDSLSRAQANFNRFPNESILALWDIRAAFPSLKHE